MVVPYALRTECSAACRRTRQRGVSRSGLGQMFGRLILYGALALALGIVAVSACGPQPNARSSPSTPAPSASRSLSPTAAPSTSATSSVRPSATATAAPTLIAGPGTSPAAACPRTTGGNASNQAQLVAVRVAHQAGFDRVLLWGTGLDHLACPKVSELAGPFRVVLDFPTPP